jgi:hypothetical protein
VAVGRAVEAMQTIAQKITIVQERLLGRALRQLLGRRRQLLGPRGHVARRRARLGHDGAQLRQHGLQGEAHRVLVGERPGLDREVAPRDGVGERGRRVQVLGHAAHGADEVAELVVRSC